MADGRALKSALKSGGARVYKALVMSEGLKHVEPMPPSCRQHEVHRAVRRRKQLATTSNISATGLAGEQHVAACSSQVFPQ